MKKSILLFVFALTFQCVSAQKNHSWAVDVSTGYEFYTQGSGGVFVVNTGILKQISSKVSLGLTTGCQLPKEGDPIIPVLADFRYTIPIENSKVEILGIARVGWYWNTGDSHGIMNNFGFQVLPGVQLRATDKIKVRLCAGFEKIFTTSSGGDFDMIPLQVGATFSL